VYPLPRRRRSQAAAGEAAAAAATAATRPRQLQSARAAKYAATAAVGTGGGLMQERELPLLESLAQLLGLSVQEAAGQLLEMTAEQRADLRRGFAAQDDPSLGPSNGGKGGKGGGGGSSGAAAAAQPAEENGLDLEGPTEEMDAEDGSEGEFEVQSK